LKVEMVKLKTNMDFCTKSRIENIQTKFIKIVIICILFYSITPLYADIPSLHVDGSKIKDPNGDVVILRGISLIDLGAQEIYYDRTVIEVIDLVTDKNDTQGSSPGWYPNILRLPICPPEYGGPLPYTLGSDYLYDNLLRPVVDYCAAKGVYCIIDLHYVDPIESNPTYVEQFWSYMAQRFANDSHVLFELFNEPSNDTHSDEADWATVRPYMQDWTNLVRSYAPDNLILIGTPAWCGILTPCVANPISGTNIVYVVHTYWVHWPYQYFRDEMINLSSVAPLIMTEWGFSTSNGDVSTISEYGQPLDDFREQYGISNTAWVASTDWGPPMFWSNWTLRCGEGEMGCFVKDTLYLRRNDDQPSWLYGDLTHDNKVDMNDLSEFCEIYWLVTDCNNTELELNGDCLINFYEFSFFAQNWLEEVQ